MQNKNVILEKSFAFSVKILKTHKILTENKVDYVICRQFVWCGTSIGANIEEGVAGQSLKDFIYKFQISYKEAKECHYWIRLLKRNQTTK